MTILRIATLLLLLASSVESAENLLDGFAYEDVLDEMLTTEGEFFPIPEGVVLSLGDSEKLDDAEALERANSGFEGAAIEASGGYGGYGAGGGSLKIPATGAFDYGCSCYSPYKYGSCWWTFRGWSGYYPTNPRNCPGYTGMWRAPCPVLHACTEADPPCWSPDMDNVLPPTVGWCIGNAAEASKPCPTGYNCPHLIMNMPADGRKYECGYPELGCGGKKTRDDCIICIANKGRVFASRAMGAAAELEGDYPELYGNKNEASKQSIKSRMKFNIMKFNDNIAGIKKVLSIAGDVVDVATAISDDTQQAHTDAFLALGECMIAKAGGKLFWTVETGSGYYRKFPGSERRYWGSGDYYSKQRISAEDTHAPFGDCIFECMDWVKTFKDAIGFGLGDKGRPGDLLSAALSIPTLQYVMCADGMDRYLNWLKNT